MFQDITVTRHANAPLYAHIYLTSRVDVFSLLRSISYGDFHENVLVPALEAASSPSRAFLMA